MTRPTWHRGACPQCGFPVLVARWPTLRDALHDHDHACHPELFHATRTPADEARLIAHARRWDARSQAEHS